jgi:hypothetical protein
VTLEELLSYLESLQAAEYVAGTGFSVKFGNTTKNFSAGELRTEINNVQSQINELRGPGPIERGAASAARGLITTREEAAAKERGLGLTAGQKKLAGAQDKLTKNYLSAIEKRENTAKEVAGLVGTGLYKTEKDLQLAEQGVRSAEQALNRAGLFVSSDGSIVRRTSTGGEKVVFRPSAEVPTEATSRIAENPLTAATAAASLGKTKLFKKPLPDDDKKTPPRATEPTTPAGVARPAVNNWIETQIELRNLIDNKSTRDALRAEYRKSKFDLPPDWKEKFAARYPALEYLLNENIFGPEITAIVERAVREKWFLYPETAAAVIKREIANTPYGMNATEKQENFDKKSGADQLAAVEKRLGDLQKSYGTLGLSNADWQRLAYVAERNGEDDLLTQQRLFQSIYERTPEGARRYETATRMVENGKLGQEVNREFGKYLLKAPDDAIEMYATGQTTLEAIRQQSRAAAKFMFPALAGLIDQGVDVKFVADQYASTAADVLEMPTSSVDMMDPRFRVALDVRDGANSRTMTLGEWQTLLKTDPNYGWQYTKTANQQAMDISTTIARAFGKIL